MGGPLRHGGGDAPVRFLAGPNPSVKMCSAGQVADLPVGQTF